MSGDNDRIRAALNSESDGQQQTAAEVLRRIGFGVISPLDPQTSGVVAVVAQALAEAARPGQELRARVEALAAWFDTPDPASPTFPDGTRMRSLFGGGDVAFRLRAALEDPR